MQQSDTCTKCGETKSIEDFPFHGGYRLHTCKICKAAYTKAYRDERPKYFNDKVKERTKANKLKAIEYLGGKCKDCGGLFHHSVYDLHHRDSNEKEISPNRLMSRCWENMIEELNKCDLLCANCHRLRHHGGE